ncbi:hypothetical protein [Paludibacter sp. 221]|uniref:hypothetical protein n=1 Tax=Paludibacter sp. 221 TaxID=2302939 RepID=UPI0013D404AB|nr:hypothetical protein [Paludibacter sp. 221]
MKKIFLLVALTLTMGVATVVIANSESDEQKAAQSTSETSTAVLTQIMNIPPKTIPPKRIV